MKCTELHKDLLTWSIDHRGGEIPERYKAHIETCESCRAEWQSLRKWVQALQPQNEWTPDEGFFDRLVENGLREKRRAALTESTRRDLALDTTGFFSIFQQSGYRFVPAMVAIVLVLAPVVFFVHQSITTIGEFNFTSGNVIAQANTPLQTRKGDPIRKGTTLQTPSDSESIVHLESGAEVCIAPLSRLTFIDERTVRVDVGSVYFDMPKQKSGFEVQVPNGTVRVLGTAFGVEINKENNTITVTRGLVEVTNQLATVHVQPGNESVLVHNKPPSVAKATRIRQTVHWVADLRDRQILEELRTYYPSLAAPTPRENRP